MGEVIGLKLWKVEFKPPRTTRLPGFRSNRRS